MTALALAVISSKAGHSCSFPLKGGDVHVLLFPAAPGSDCCKTKPMVWQKLSTGAGTTSPGVAEGRSSQLGGGNL